MSVLEDHHVGFTGRVVLCPEQLPYKERSGPVLEQSGWPPHRGADVLDQGGNQQGTYDEGVQQHPEGDDEGDLRSRNRIGRMTSAAKVAASTKPAEVMTPPMTASPRNMPSRVPFASASSRTRVMRKML